MAPPEIIRYVLVRTDPNKHKDFDWAKIPQLVDEFERVERIYYGREEPAPREDVDDLRREYELSLVDPPARPELHQVPFSHLLTLVQLYPDFEAVLATRVHVNLLAGDAPDRYYELRDPATPLDEHERRLSSRGLWERTAAVSLVDEHERVRVDLDCSPVCTLLRHPVETVSQTESGFQLTYQGSCLVLAWPLKLESWVDWKGSVRLEMG